MGADHLALALEECGDDAAALVRHALHTRLQTLLRRLAVLRRTDQRIRNGIRNREYEWARASISRRDGQ